MEKQPLQFSNIDEYIKGFPEDIQVVLKETRKTIRAVAPDATEKISWQMPTFYQNGNLIHFAGQSKHLGIYPGAKGVEFASEKLYKLGIKYAKGSIRFPYSKPIPYELIAEIVRFNVANQAR